MHQIISPNCQKNRKNGDEGGSRIQGEIWGVTGKIEQMMGAFLFLPQSEFHGSDGSSIASMIASG